MHLRKLAIHALPGIGRGSGFTFEPPSAGINIVTGPNAIGKSSLARALGYLLASQDSDPPALSLEAEFESGDTRWHVSRSGNQIVWRRNGEAVPRPALPGADRIGLFRLSVENLLDDGDANDKALAERLRRELHGNFDLDQIRKSEIGRRFAQHEARELLAAEKARRGVESGYADLRRQEAKLPGLERQIEEARAAEARREHLKQALGLADAIDARKAREAALDPFPPDMDCLRGDELQKLDENEAKARGLHEELRDQQRRLENAEAALKRTGLVQSAPAPEAMQAAEERLRQLDKKSVERENVQAAWTVADAELRDALTRFNGEGDPPKLNDDAFQRTEAIAGPLIDAQNRQRELTLQLDLAGEAPDAAEMDRQRDGVEALRAWLAGNAADSSSGRTRAPTKLPWIVYWVALVATAFAAVAAYVQNALVASAGALVALLAFGVALFLQRGRRPAAPATTDEAMRRFRETDLAPPLQWNEQAVRKHLRDVEVRLNELTLQQIKAGRSEQIGLQIRDTETEIERLEKERVALAQEIGFDPCLPVAEFQRFIQLCFVWNEKRSKYVEQGARLELLDREIAETARAVGDFLGPWRAADAPALEDPATKQPDMILLRGAFDDLKKRTDEAREARRDIQTCEKDIQSLKQRTADLDKTVENLFAQAKIEPRDRAALADRIEQLPQWKEAKDALKTASNKESFVRGLLAEQPGLAALADEGKRAHLQADLDASTVEAKKHMELIERRTEIRTKLNDAGKDRELEKAAAEESRARQALEDKRDEALLAVATKTLLDDVEQAFEAEHEPAVLGRAREVFSEVTANAFELKLRSDGTFVAYDTRQETTRTLAELSSGTRMQLLLALRLAWIETQEQGGETLPLFLDEALTTSDEERFTVMAQSLERLAGGGTGRIAGDGSGIGDGAWDRAGDESGVGKGGGAGTGISAGDGDGDGANSENGAADGRRRQIFYLSARRHEPALWQRATGARPAVIDLAAVRFPSEASAPEAYRVEAPPSLPAPDGRSAETYASLLGVPPRLDPHQPEGNIHLFHLLRDDLTLLHTLMDTWRIDSLGQLEGLLASDAAQNALPGKDMRHRLRQRCRVVRTWVELWRQGRGRPVDRGALEQCPAISSIFVDRVTDLAAEKQGDGKALVRALREKAVDRFRSHRIDELEQWLADEGYTNDRERLTGEGRRRLTLQQAATETEGDTGDINRMVTWLEAPEAPEAPSTP